MSLAAFAAILSIGLQGQAPAPDRSGETAFRQILKWAKGLDNVHIVIAKSYRESAKMPFYPDSRVDLWLSGSRFRYETSGYWGDGQVVVSDGTSVLNDSMSEYEPAVMADAKGSALSTLKELKIEVDDVSPLFTLMAGPEQIDKIVEKTAFIRQEPDHGDEKAVAFAHKKLGTVRLNYHLVRGMPLLDRIDFDNMPVLKEQAKANPEWADEPDPGTLNRHDILLDSSRPSGDLFQVKPAKGREVVDKRKKKG